MMTPSTRMRLASLAWPSTGPGRFCKTRNNLQLFKNLSPNASSTWRELGSGTRTCLHAERYVLSGSTNTHMDDGLHTVFVDSKNGRIVLQTLPSQGIIGITAVI